MSNDPFDIAIAKSEKIQAEGEQLRTQQAQAASEQLRTQRLLAATGLTEEQLLIENARRFGEGFLNKVASYGSSLRTRGGISTTQWSATALRQAKEYCQALLHRIDRPLPPIDPSMASVIHDQFAYGILLYKGEIPDEFFVGQRQPWFKALYEQKQRQVNARNKLNRRNTSSIDGPNRVASRMSA